MSTTQQKTLSIDGMHCEHCVEVVREALESIRGVSVEHVEIGTADVAYDPSSVSDDQLATVLEDAGYALVSS
jgi:copper chaperone